MFWTIYFFVYFASLAMMAREGLWSNTIALVNLTTSGLVAFGFYSPLAIYLDEQTGGANTYWLDFALIWGLFIVSSTIFRVLTKFASQTRMRFKYPIDEVGSTLVGIVAAIVVSGFVMATLHTAPMPRNAFGGKLVSAEEVSTASAFKAPDAGWLRFVESVAGPVAFGPNDRKVFSAQAFTKIYGDRREQFSSSNAKWLRVQR